MTQTELILKVQADTATSEEVTELYNSVSDFIRKIALQYSGQLRCHHVEDGRDKELDDFVQEGFFCVIDAAKSYDPEAGASFLTYLSWFLRRAFEEHLAKSTGTNSTVIRERYALGKYEAEFKALHGYDPTDEMICIHFNITAARLNYLHSIGSGAISLDTPIGDDSDEDTLVSLVASGSNTEEEVIDRLTHEEVQQVLRGFINELPAAQRIAVVSFYILGKTDKQGAASVHMSVNKFRKYRKDGLKNLRMRKNLETLGRYLPERVGSVAYKSADSHKWQSSTERAAFMSIHEEYWIRAHHIKHEVDDALYKNNGG